MPSDSNGRGCYPLPAGVLEGGTESFGPLLEQFHKLPDYIVGRELDVRAVLF